MKPNHPEKEIPILRQTPFSKKELSQLSKAHHGDNLSKYDSRPDFKVAADGCIAFCKLEQENSDHYVTLVAPDVVGCECIILKAIHNDSFWMLHVEPQFLPTEEKMPNIIKAINQDENLKNLTVDAVFINQNNAHSFTLTALNQRGVQINRSKIISSSPADKDIFFTPRDGKIHIYYQNDGFFKVVKNNFIAAVPDLNLSPEQNTIYSQIKKSILNSNTTQDANNILISSFKTVSLDDSYKLFSNLLNDLELLDKLSVYNASMFFSNLNSNIWQDTLSKIREETMNKLNDKLDGISDDNEKLYILKNAKKQPIFRKHRHNYLVTGAWGRTTTIKMIETKIDDILNKKKLITLSKK